MLAQGRDGLGKTAYERHQPEQTPHACFVLSKLAVWWLLLGMGIERIKPCGPQQNGRHEHMHRALK